jgi:hypothetical protein
MEQIWPSEMIPFSAEASLEFLMYHKYNYDKVKNLVRFKDSSFRNFIQAKKFIYGEVDKIATQNKKSYQ